MSWAWSAIAGVAGTLLTEAFVTKFLQPRIDAHRKKKELPAASPALDLPPAIAGRFMGIAERAFFCLAIGFALGGTATAMVVWAGLRGALLWNKPESRDSSAVHCALLTGLVSLTFAMLGGMLCSYALWRR